MRSDRFINSLLYFVIQLVAKESKAKENNAGIKCLFVLFLEKRYMSQVFHFKGSVSSSMPCTCRLLVCLCCHHFHGP